ncbi:hypothetical protein PVL30_001590 [Lodderomyces elongisporus]|uniref:uncharacterized protein n=1 Tax=Lodderomyces elongisporus TaxID=36914 RepID=UPI002924894D|nr:uncharacterized protein PVL30_001590 [Lodderomyces elongisporus]WLF77868.1 hypothetical protein PVL30_001590 [Lodderomyces elongisporus]
MNGDNITGNEPWNELSSPESEFNLIDSGARNSRSRTQSTNPFRLDELENENTPALEKGTAIVEESDSHRCIIRALSFVGYAVTTILFYIIIYLHYFAVRFSYDEETAMSMLDGVFRAQERSIDNYHKRLKRAEEATAATAAAATTAETSTVSGFTGETLDHGGDPPHYR